MKEAEGTLKEQLRNPRLGRGAQEGSKLLKRTGGRDVLLRFLTEEQMARIARAAELATSEVSPRGLSCQGAMHVMIDFGCELAEQSPEAWRVLAAFIAQSAAGIGTNMGPWASIQGGRVLAGAGNSAHREAQIAVTIDGCRIERVAEGY